MDTDRNIMHESYRYTNSHEDGDDDDDGDDDRLHSAWEVLLSSDIIAYGPLVGVEVLIMFIVVR